MYVEEKGKGIKGGEIKYKEDGVTIKEDPTAVLDLPVWSNKKGETLDTVSKKINTKKGQVLESDDPFYEFSIMEIVNSLGFQTTKPVAKIQKGDSYMFLMTRVKGYRLVGEDVRDLGKKLNKDQSEFLKEEAERMIDQIKHDLEEVGLIRSVKLKDFIFDIDFSDRNNPKIIQATPIDWERTKIDEVKLKAALEKVGK